MILLDEPTERVCAAVAAGELTPVRLAIVAPGGYGKTTVLERLARPGLRLVDDAHLLGDAELGELLRYLEDEQAEIVIATRPHPRRVVLNQVLARLRGQIVLRPFDVARTATFLESTGSREQAEFVHTQTGGVPGLVRAATELNLLRHELDHAGEDVVRYLVAAEAGAGGDQSGPVIEAAHATGLLSPDGRLLPIAARALRELVPQTRQVALRRQLVQRQLERGGPVLPLVRPLLEAGLTGPEIGAAFEAAADEAEPELAAKLYEAAAKAGRQVGARWAEAVARAGDFDMALRLADELIAAEDPGARAEGAHVAGTALAHRGQLARSAELFQWAGTGDARCFGAIALVGTGRLADAERALDECSGTGPPTLLSGAVTGAARGIVESVTEQPAVALSTLVRAAEMLEPVSGKLLLPDSPAALGALVALHSGEAAIAEPLLERAIEAGALVARHRLLLAWISMVRGDEETAVTRLRDAGDGLSPRDWLFAVGLRVGLARRASDLATLRRIWGQAREAVVRHPVDLFTFLPFGEFEVAAARLGERDRLAPHLRQARQLLAALGDPPLWATALHWSGLHAAILDEQPGEAAEHAAALAEGAGTGPYFAAMSRAAECWLKVLGGEVDPIAVEAAARGLHDVGLCWDGARLAGQAAIRTSDRKVMVTLLDCARVLQGRDPAVTPGPARLSDRERQVAELVLAGMTYKQIGDRLFISAKTVEHHMARMRQRLGAGSRSELLAELRAELEPAEG
ncbi:DNA-binding CsgD family transcriptional regulator [Amycolatopsis bartoniae]|uniref:Helix-turn-helix transcriptional regulator n=1 Tax=Amycolatopsis bartoniae TaxID=941986 RepID=A0A8H9MBZ7_9PSEU|nr:helix-turn-helix transcriptional regulator [Amycolatopsis bartoniae]MBB2933436.1 DNA-binding CsgD family transcriptional regulator [Amycolatopsis bartoniae]TVT06601.1 helix-turn-helix transcriptional regulator [Amycolatopsis bartoniae]GHF59429.1 helix-turn-helix transcriptional regulator [Amycolatopsis bartoniae]